MTALTVFRTVVEHGSFAAASRKLGLSPAAISKNVSELEAHLSTQLINRTTRRMNLTEAGAVYFERVVRILDDLKDADGSIQANQNNPSGLLRVSAPMTLTLVGLSEVIPRFLDRYPDLSLDLNLDDRRVNLIEEGFDIALRGSDNLEDSNLIARKLLTMEHVLCASPLYFERHGFPQQPGDLEQHNCIQFTLSGHAKKWSFSIGNRTVAVPVRGRYQVSSSLAVRDALRAGFGLSLIPRMYVADDLASGRLCTALDDWTPNETSLYAVYPSRRYVDSKVRVFLDFLVEELRG
ncbi:LysR family transcriptional regulator [Ruegeria sp. Ofav3-42]|uniref:LysR family transcriptional regulator n=1 Tax=Ruegeria sp. Ofav3-42 TaxID=2917759 RepID=UPI001EF6BC04|nr:LysR family transcriptional regulator [Ruegeria sp. Ofav3-42]MCG7521846.1 LysR family transcriptional regulator [Ruegeria sp. Ofav3-42]